MKHTLSALVLLSAVALPALANAQELGAKGDAVFSADRMMGITGNHVSFENGPLEGDADWTAFSFGWRDSPSPFDVPRLSFDYLVIDHLSVGGSLGYFSINGDGDDDDVSGFLLNPRVGYAYAFGRVVGIWPRAGFTYHSSDFGQVDESGFALSLECPFTFSPTSHFAFTAGPTFDIDMFGERDFGPADGDWKYRAFGLNAGLLGWF
jgi:hypothetical protein